MTNAEEIVPVLAVGSWDEARHYYVDVLGFAEGFSFGEPPTYGGVRAGPDDASPWIHLNVAPPGSKVHPGEVYVFVEEVDDLFARLKGAGAEVVFEPGDREYGLRDFMVEDPWGNRLSFGVDLDEGD